MEEKKEIQKLPKKTITVKRRKRSFPLLGTLIFIIGLIWLITTVSNLSGFPLWPTVLTLLGFAMIFERAL
ncbi:MAG: hypothetical protein ACI83O_000920 [Patescibacteria group bacterium]|jgi:hypothetical protein